MNASPFCDKRNQDERNCRTDRLFTQCSVCPLQHCAPCVLPESEKRNEQRRSTGSGSRLGKQYIQKKLLGSLPSLKASLFAMQVTPKVPTGENDNPFLAELEANMRETLSWIANYSGIYISYSLSSTSQAMKVEPYLIAPAEKGNYVEVIHNNVYGTTHHGAALMNGTNHLYLAFNEHKTPQLALFHISLKLPMYDRPPFLRGVYTCFDYNYNPIARRILFVKVSESVARDEFMKLKGQLKTYDQLDEKEKRYYQYTCQPEDIIRICNIPSPTMTEEDLDMEKKLLTISK